MVKKRYFSLFLSLILLLLVSILAVSCASEEQLNSEEIEVDLDVDEAVDEAVDEGEAVMVEEEVAQEEVEEVAQEEIVQDEDEEVAQEEDVVEEEEVVEEAKKYEVDLTVGSVPEELEEFSEYFSKYVNVFGVNIFASSGVNDKKVLHAANVMAEYLDNDEDGYMDNQLVVDKMVEHGASMIMFESENKLDNSDIWETDLEERYQIQDLLEDETNPSGSKFDASLEEVLHLITFVGYAEAYPDVFGEFSGTTLANIMDEARGGHFEEGENWDEDSGRGDSAVPNSYPSASWYHYDDDTCSYGCMITEYIYWALTSILGAQEDRCSKIDDEWELCTNELVQEKDEAIYDLLMNSGYGFATELPDGNYEGPQK